MGTGLEVAIYAGLAASAVGGGISAYNSFQSAATQKNIANYNYAMQQRNAKQQLMMNSAQVRQMEQQARFQQAQAEINARLAENEAQARANNAQSFRNQALAQASADRENIRRSNMDAQREIARARAVQAKSGGQLDAASMLETEVESERAKTGIAQELAYQSELGYRKTFAEAVLEDFGAATTLAQAEMDLAVGLAEANLTRSAAALKEVGGRSQYIMDQKRATIDRVAGLASAKGSKLQGWGTLFQTAGSVATGWANWQQIGASATKAASTAATASTASSTPWWGGTVHTISQRPPGLA